MSNALAISAVTAVLQSCLNAVYNAPSSPLGGVSIVGGSGTSFARLPRARWTHGSRLAARTCCRRKCWKRLTGRFTAPLAER